MAKITVEIRCGKKDCWLCHGIRGNTDEDDTYCGVFGATLNCSLDSYGDTVVERLPECITAEEQRREDQKRKIAVMGYQPTHFPQANRDQVIIRPPKGGTGEVKR